MYSPDPKTRRLTSETYCRCNILNKKKKKRKKETRISVYPFAETQFYSVLYARSQILWRNKRSTKIKKQTCRRGKWKRREVFRKHFIYSFERILGLRESWFLDFCPLFFPPSDRWNLLAETAESSLKSWKFQLRESLSYFKCRKIDSCARNSCRNFTYHRGKFDPTVEFVL